MASQIGTLRAVLNLDASGFRQGFERAQSAAATFQKRMRRVEFRMKRFGRKMERVGQSMTFGLTVPIGTAAVAAVKSAAEFEALGVQMEVLTGSAEEGAAAFEKLKKFSARTPFQLKDLTRAQNTLMGFGESTEDAFKHLQMLGDVAAVTGGDLQAITVAFGQASAEGKLMTRDIRQLINQGVPAIKMLSESMGVAQSEILDLASQGEITFDVLVDSFEKATREGGMFADGTERLANTLSGVFSTLKDNVSLALGELGQTISETLNLKQVAKDISTALKNITDRFASMSNESQTQILKLVGLFAISGPVAFAIGKFVGLLSGLLKVVRKVFKAMVTIVSTSMGRIGLAFLVGIAIGQRFFDNMTALAEGRLKDFDLSFSGFADSAVKGIKKVFGPLIDLADKGFGQLAEGIGEAIGFKESLKSFYGLFEEGSERATEKTQEHTEAIKENIKAMIQRARLSDVVSVSGPVGGPNVAGRTAQSQFGSAGEAALSGTTMGAMEERLRKLRESIQNAIPGTENFKALREEIGQMNSEIFSLQTHMVTTGEIMQNFAVSLGQAFSQAALHARSLLDSLENIAKQLASKALVTALRFLLPGGPIFGKASFFGTMFGGGFAHGGIAPGGKFSLVGESGPELIAPKGPTRVTPLGAMGGSLNIRITGELRGDGKELVGVVKSANYDIGR